MATSDAEETRGPTRGASGRGEGDTAPTPEALQLASPVDRGAPREGWGTALWPMPVVWTRRVIVGLVVAALVVGFVGRHGGAVLASFALAFAALAVGLLSLPDGDPEID